MTTPGQVLASCTGDTNNGLTLVESTVGARSSPLFGLYSIAQDGRDPALYYSHFFYRDLERTPRAVIIAHAARGWKQRDSESLTLRNPC